MKFIFTVLLLFITTFTSTYSQQQDPDLDLEKKCFEAEQRERLIQSLSEEERHQFYLEEEELLNFTKTFIEKNPDVLQNKSERGEATYTIPVVFHIIHDGGSENISDAQVHDCIRIMNEDFRKLNSDANNVKSEFLDLVADSEIEFKLARKDPYGNCTNGITRTRSTVTYDGTEAERIQVVQEEHGNWRGDRYMNVFSVAGFEFAGAAGYTYRPSSWAGTGMGNGIHMLHSYVGSIGTGSVQRSRTMTHEAGHWLNLPHTWGNSNNPGLASNCGDDDGVEDTPNTIGWQSCNRNGESCESLDNVENYMEYSYCSKMFTLGQKARMHAALNSSVGGRNNVVTESNLSITGVNERDVLCKANFNVKSQTVCSGQLVEFTDLSYHNPTKWEWEFPGAYPATSTEQNPAVIYDSSGTFNVTLTIYDDYDTITVVKEAFIKSLPEPANLPFIEDFEDTDSIINLSWSVHNPGENAAFEIDSIAHTGYKGIRLENYGEAAGNIDELISAPLDLSHVSGDVTLSFRFAYRKRHQDNNERVRVLISNDCAETWAVRRTIFGSQLSDIIESDYWEPESQEDWTTIHMTNITSAFWVEDFRVKFQFESDGGNNFYIDDINLYNWGPSELSVDEHEVLNKLNVFPNPASKEVNVAFTLENNKETNVQLLSLTGQVVESTSVQGIAGDNLVVIPSSHIKAGTYLIKIRTDNSEQVKRVVIL